MSTRIKPPFGVLLRHDHPLASGVAGAWLFNEGRGDSVWDVSGAGHTGALMSMTPSSDWVSGPHGHALDFDGVDDRVLVGPEIGISLGTVNSCVIRFKLHFSSGVDLLVAHRAYNDGGYTLGLGAAGKVYYCANGSYVSVTHGIVAGDEVWLGVSREGTSVRFYKDGVPLGSPQTLAANNALTISAIGCYRTASELYATSMRCDYAYCWRRALSAAEMAWLFREPFSFTGRSTPLLIIGSSGGIVHNGSGVATVRSSSTGTITVTADADLPTGESWSGQALRIDAFWQRDVILNGMTDTAMKLSTGLTQGWFWMRRLGCTAVYSDAGVSKAVTGMMICVAPPDAIQVLLPAHAWREAGLVGCYLVRRFNACGHCERTMDATVVVRVNPNGGILSPFANVPLDVRTQPAPDGGIELTWFYCPLDQATPPDAFRIYSDGGTGDIDFAHPLGSLPYAGRGHYRWRGQLSGIGRSLFAVRAENQWSVERPPQAIASCNPPTGVSNQPDIFGVEAI